MKKLEGKVALITGSSLGIGKGIALCFAKEGADIVINYRSHKEDAIKVANEVRKLGQKALVYKADVANREQIKNMFADIVKEFGHIDIVVSNAATHNIAPMIEAKWEDVMRTVNVSQLGAYTTCQLAAQQLVEQNNNNRLGGKIIIISSIVVDECPLNHAAYSMAKAGVSRIGKTLAGELAKYHINVNIINPGYIDTPGEHKLASDESMKQAAKNFGWGRLGTPEDIGKAAVFLASDDAEYISGATLLVDGAQTSE